MLWIKFVDLSLAQVIGNGYTFCVGLIAAIWIGKKKNTASAVLSFLVTPKLFKMDWVKAVEDTEKPAVCVVRN